MFGFFNTSSKNDNIKVGDRVYIRRTGQTGYVIDKTGNMVLVSITQEDDTDVVKTYTASEVELAEGII